MTGPELASATSWRPSTVHLWPADAGVPPRFATARRVERATIGGRQARLSALLGRPYMPHQAYIADVAGEVLEDGTMPWHTVVVTTQRQVGKTSLLKPVAFDRCAAARRQAVWMTAQNRDKARDRYLDLGEDVTDLLNLRPDGTLLPRSQQRVHVNTSNSHERAIWTATRSFIRPFAPGEDQMHGEDADVVLVDEVWAFTILEASLLTAAYRPGLRRKIGHSQEWLTSTKGTSRSEWLEQLVKAGRANVEANVDHGLAFFEWGIPSEVDGVPVAELPDRELIELVIAHHPAVGLSTPREAIEAALEDSKLDPLRGRSEFIRAYGNLTAEADGWVVLTESTWTGSKTTELVIPPRFVLGVGAVDASEDPRDTDVRVAVMAAGRVSDGQVVAELIAAGEGGKLAGKPAARVIADLATRHKVAVYVLTDTPAGRNLADELGAHKVTTERVLNVDAAAGVIRLREGLKSRAVIHRGGPSLTDSARRAEIGKGIWVGPSSAPVRAMTAAVWGVDRPVEGPSGSFRILVPSRKVTT
jgi:hypothetical protein